MVVLEHFVEVYLKNLGKISKFVIKTPPSILKRAQFFGVTFSLKFQNNNNNNNERFTPSPSPSIHSISIHPLVVLMSENDKVLDLYLCEK
jgi:hypothetical protein